MDADYTLIENADGTYNIELFDFTTPTAAGAEPHVYARATMSADNMVWFLVDNVINAE